MRSSPVTKTNELSSESRLLVSSWRALAVPRPRLVGLALLAIAGMLSSTTEVSAQNVFTRWDFNYNPFVASPPATNPTQSIGAGSAQSLGGISVSFQTLAGTTDPG